MPGTLSRSFFRRELAGLQTDPAGRRWLFVAYDQLSGDIGPLAKEDPRALGILLVENTAKAALRPYHKQKLALVLTNLRHFALEQAARGVAVEYVATSESYASVVADVARRRGPLRMMEAAERELRHELRPLVQSGALTVVPHEGWLTSARDLEDSQRGTPWRMDAFYRHVRRRTGYLMEGAKPTGGRFSFDGENRRPWRGEPPAPPALRFPPDEVTREVGALLEERFPRHPGRLELDALPASHADAERLWAWAKASCLPWFGPFEDAMSSHSAGLFHTRISPLLNLHRLLPRRVVEDAMGLPLPLPSKEGFVRQILGWREFMAAVHRASDGFRQLPGGPADVAPHPGDGGYRRWAGAPWSADAGPRGEGGSLTSYLGAREPLPPAFWGEPSGLRCLDHVVDEVWDSGWSHHITRLMILGNIATLLDVSPRELTDWFWAAYIDAYDWVVEPNVHGMATFGLGDLFVTKPYIAGAPYVARMSDYCKGCAFDPKTTCPLTPLYWAFLERHRDQLAPNPRLLPIYRALEKRPSARREGDARCFQEVGARLAKGLRLTPAH